MTLLSDTKITFKNGYLTVEIIRNRFNITPKLFWRLFKNFRGVGLFINKKRPWMIDILFYIVVHDPQIWVKVDVLKKLGTDHSFCFGFVL